MSRRCRVARLVRCHRSRLRADGTRLKRTSPRQISSFADHFFHSSHRDARARKYQHSAGSSDGMTDGSDPSAPIAEGLVREYLHRHRLTDTLAAFERERPRDASSITSSTTLKKHLGTDLLVNLSTL